MGIGLDRLSEVSLARHRARTAADDAVKHLTLAQRCASLAEAGEHAGRAARAAGVAQEAARTSGELAEGLTGDAWKEAAPVVKSAWVAARDAELSAREALMHAADLDDAVAFPLAVVA